ncbi:ATP-dependent metallopeptidase FtsH/Yme1/Tma family protein [Candidatus Uhrbacteria bacterium]|nr:ATP-dependent metallopeptidase FtsH/Yme1/Tma family protein [Candidatus Uhrbacteria bacterium]
MNPLVKNILIFLVVLFAAGAFFSLYTTQNLPQKKEVGIEVLVSDIAEKKAQKIQVKGDTITVSLSDNTQHIIYKEPTESLSTLLSNYGVDPELLRTTPIEVADARASFWINTALTLVLPFLIVAFFIWLMIRQVQGASNRAMMFGASRARQYEKGTKEKVTFADVAGAKEAKEELAEVIEFLKNPEKFTSVGARVPKGTLLVGAPGTGKTLLAKAVAGEADVPFFHVSGSEFIEMFVGVGASRVRDTFQRAKKSAPCIIFIDEIDAVGRQRGAGLGGSHDEREQTLNQILVELDGFDPSVNIVVLAATNRPDILDPALLRPGRFDRRVVIDLPSLDDREAILKVHAKKKPLAEEVSLRKIAERTPGFSGADLANLMNEAAILAARENRKTVTMNDLFSSIEKVILGPERKSHVMSDKEKKITAYHEGGHALVSHVLPDAPAVQKVSVISRGQAAGYTLNLPTEDKHFRARKEFLSELAVLLGGYVSEQTVFGDVTTGASNDLKKATQLARKLIMQYGMSENLGQRTFGQREELIFLGREITEQRDYSEKTAEEIDAEIAKLIKDAFHSAEDIITKHRETLEQIVKVLTEKETIEHDEFARLFGEKVGQDKDTKEKKIDIPTKKAE